MSVHKPLMFIVALLSPTASVAAPSGQTAADLFVEQVQNGASWRSHRYLLTPRPNQTAASEAEVLSTPCWVDSNAPYAPFFVVECPSTSSDFVWIETLAALPSTRWVDANYHVTLTGAPNDLHPSQWHLQNTGQKIGNVVGTPEVDIGAVSAWDIQVGKKDIIVAIPDTGVFLDHNDLQTNLWLNPGEVCGNSEDDDGNGLVDDCNGWDFGDSDPDVSPLNIRGSGHCPIGHGTFIAGLIGADTFTDDGIAGLNWNVSLLPLKIVEDDGCAITAESLSLAVLYAVEAGADVISTSFSMTEYVEAIENAFAYASEQGVLVTIAAGNDTQHVDDEVTYPIDFGHDGTLTVAASTNTDQQAAFTNYGERVHLYAPGLDLFSLGTHTPNHYKFSSGTSYAAPLVAGTGSLLISEYPDLTVREVQRILLNSTIYNESWDCALHDRCVATSGRLHTAQALEHADRMATGPYLTLQELVFKERVGEAPGDLDGRLERGEVAYLYPAIENLGVSRSESVQAEIYIEHPYVVMGGHQITYQPISSKQASVPWEPVTISVAQSCDENQLADVQITLTETPSGRRWSERHWVPIYCIIDEDGDGSLYPQDCNDSDPNIYPGAVERCNGYDDNCDGLIDGLGSQGSVILYQDSDDDGYGNPSIYVSGCEDTEGWSTTERDCDDQNETVYPDAPEFCDQLDNDCDSQIDENPVDPKPWYIDSDGDGLGNPTLITIACEQPEQHVDNALDCDDKSDKPCERMGSCTTIPFSFTCIWLGLPFLIRNRRTH